jgi:hypothetical protein
MFIYVNFPFFPDQLPVFSALKRTPPWNPPGHQQRQVVVLRVGSSRARERPRAAGTLRAQRWGNVLAGLEILQGSEDLKALGSEVQLWLSNIDVLCKSTHFWSFLVNITITSPCFWGFGLSQWLLRHSLVVLGRAVWVVHAAGLICPRPAGSPEFQCFRIAIENGHS